MASLSSKVLTVQISLQQHCFTVTDRQPDGQKQSLNPTCAYVHGVTTRKEKKYLTGNNGNYSGPGKTECRDAYLCHAERQCISIGVPSLLGYNPDLAWYISYLLSNGVQ